MSGTLKQVFDANPASSMQDTDLFYLVRSPYDSGNSMGITWANVLASIPPSEINITVGEGLTSSPNPILGTATIGIQDGGVSSAKLATESVTFSKIQQINSSSLLGNSGPSAGSVNAIPLGAGLSFGEAGELNADIQPINTLNVNTSAYTILVTDDVILVDTTLIAGPSIIQLPNFVSKDGQSWVIKDSSGGALAYPITISGNGWNIDAEATFVLDEAYQAITITWSTASTKFNATAAYGDYGRAQKTLLVDTPTYVVTEADDIILVATNTIAEPSTIELSNSPSKDAREWTIKDYGNDAETYNITVSGNGWLIDGSPTFIINKNNQAVTFCWDKAQTTYSAISEFGGSATGSGVDSVTVNNGLTQDTTTGNIIIGIDVNGVQYGQFQKVNAATLVGNSGLSVDDIGPITLADTLSFSASVLGLSNTTVTPGSYTLANITIDAQGRVTDASNANLTGDVTNVGNATTIASNAVTYDKIQTIPTLTLLGNSTGSTANVEPLTLSSAFYFDGSELNVNVTDTSNVTVVNTTSYTVLITDQTILVDTAVIAAPSTVTLLATAANGQLFTIKDIGNQAQDFPITINVAGSGNIDSSSTFIINQNRQAINLRWSNTLTGYVIVAEYDTEISPAGPMPWNDVSTSILLSANNGYFCTAAAVLVMPADAVQGTLVSVIVDVDDEVTVLANTGQFMRIGDQINIDAEGFSTNVRGNMVNYVFREAISTWISLNAPIGSWSLT